MIVRINTGKKPAGAVRYNEEKVANGQARSIGILNYQLDNTDDLSVRKKIDGLELYAKLNTNVSTPTLHISMAFHPSENFTDDQLKTMGEEYMQKMGYGNQPMLIYRHEDTHHPHIHIVSVSIDDSGKKISDSNVKRRSNVIRKEMELNYGLVKAEEQGKQQVLTTKLPEQILEYGEAETKKAIGNIVRTAFTEYSFSSTDTFAQFLATYHIQLNQLKGQSKSGQTYQGISFQLTNGEEAISPAIKASTYHFAPTQDRLTNRFKHGKKRIDQAKPQFLQRVQKALEPYHKVSEDKYKNQLRAAGIQLLDTGKEFIYIDHPRRVVFNESELDPRLSRNHLLGAFASESSLKPLSVVSPLQPDQPVNQPLPVKPTDGVSKPLAENESIQLRKQVGRLYQAHRKEAGHYFESQTIEHFPYEALTNSLVQQGVQVNHAQTAVRQFEYYKQHQLPEIKSKEESYFRQTGGIYLKLATQMPITAQSRFGFLESMNLRQLVGPDGEFQLVHRHNPAMRLTLTADQQQALLKGGPQSVAFPATLGKADREVFLAAASGQLPQTASFYTVNGALLKSSLPPDLYASVSTALNKNYLQQVINHCGEGGRSLAEQLLDRGIVVQKSEQGYRAGYCQTPSPSFTQLPAVFTHQLEKEGLPSGYAEQVDRIKSYDGRRLVSAVQSVDTGNQFRLEGLKRQVANGVEKTFLSPSDVVTALREKLQKPPATPPGLTPRTSKPRANPSEAAQKAKALQDALWKDYFGFRGRNGYFYESALLQKPAEFPTTRLVQLLTSPPHGVEPLDAVRLVQAFYQHRLNRLDAIIKRDEDHFARTSQGFLTMINQAPLSGPDRQKAIKALYLDVHRDNEGNLALVHHQHKSFRMPLSGSDAQQLLKGIPPEQAQSIALPNQEFPRFERALYEQIVLGKTFTKSDEGKEQPSFRNVMGERVKVLLSSEGWERASRLLNEHTMASLLNDAPLKVESKLDWLYQRGMVIAQTREGYRLGHYLTDPAHYAPAPASLVKLLESYRPAGNQANQSIEALLQTQRRLVGLTTERGKAMLSLAQAIDQKNTKRVDALISKLVQKVPSIASLANQPEKILAYLSTAYGPLQAPKERQEVHSIQPTIPSPPENEQGGLLDALADGSDTSQMRKKQRVGQPLRKLRPKR